MAHAVVVLKQMQAMRSVQCDRAVSRRRISFVALCVGLDTGAEPQQLYFRGPVRMIRCSLLLHF
jgi:hypothetical protein